MTQTPVVWKVSIPQATQRIQSPGTQSMCQSSSHPQAANVTYTHSPGFAIAGSGGQAIHVSVGLPHIETIHVPELTFIQMGNSGVLKSRGGGVFWAAVSGRRNQVMARNETNIPQRFVLGLSINMHRSLDVTLILIANRFHRRRRQFLGVFTFPTHPVSAF